MFFDEFFFDEETAKSREEAVDILCRRLSENGSVADYRAFREAVRRRESEASTELAPHIFVPHAKSEAVRKSAVAAMQTQNGETVYLLASANEEEHMQQLSALCRMLLENENTPPGDEPGGAE